MEDIDFLGLWKALQSFFFSSYLTFSISGWFNHLQFQWTNEAYKKLHSSFIPPLVSLTVESDPFGFQYNLLFHLPFHNLCLQIFYFF